MNDKKQMLENMLLGRVDPNVNAMRQVIAKVEKKEMNNIVAEGQSINIGPKRKPMNANITKMPKEFYSNMLPSQEETDRLWSPSDNGYINGLSKSILSEERDIPSDKFNTYEQLNEKLNNYKNVPQNGHKLNSLPFTEQQIRSIIKEEVYDVLNDIVKQEGENRLLKETIQIRIGSSIFSGNLSKIMTKLKNKK